MWKNVWFRLPGDYFWVSIDVQSSTTPITNPVWEKGKVKYTLCWTGFNSLLDDIAKPVHMILVILPVTSLKCHCCLCVTVDYSEILGSRADKTKTNSDTPQKNLITVGRNMCRPAWSEQELSISTTVVSTISGQCTLPIWPWWVSWNCWPSLAGALTCVSILNASSGLQSMFGCRPSVIFQCDQITHCTP